MLKVQEYLLSHSLDDLAKEHGVYARFSTKNPKKFTLNYDMLEAKDGNPIAEECRGLVLELVGDVCFDCVKDPKIHLGKTRVLAYPFKRFYNHGQGAASDIDWNTAKFYEKLDGTLCIVYFDPSLYLWCVGTRSVPDADIPFENVTGKTFRELFAKAATATYLPWKKDFAKGFTDFCDLFLVKKFTYMFELCTPENEPNCIKHKNYKIWLLAVRDNETLLEREIDHPDLIVCPSHELTPESIFDFVYKRSHLEYEGLVICDANFNRIKVKNPAYVLASKMKDSAIRSPRNLLELILMEKDDDVRPLLPEKFQEELDKIKDKLKDFLAVEQEWFIRNIFIGMNSENKDQLRKPFALKVQENKRCLPLQMFMFDNLESNPKHWIELRKNKDQTWPNAFLDNLMKMIGAHDGSNLSSGK